MDEVLAKAPGSRRVTARRERGETNAAVAMVPTRNQPADIGRRRTEADVEREP